MSFLKTDLARCAEVMKCEENHGAGIKALGAVYTLCSFPNAASPVFSAIALREEGNAGDKC